MNKQSIESFMRWQGYSNFKLHRLVRIKTLILVLDTYLNHYDMQRRRYRKAYRRFKHKYILLKRRYKLMTYKERYYRDHKDDKKPWSTRIYEWVVVGTFAVSFIMMLSCMLFIGYWYPQNPTLWIVTYVVSVLVCVFTFDLRVKDDDDIQKDLGIK